MFKSRQRHQKYRTKQILYLFRPVFLCYTDDKDYLIFCLFISQKEVFAIELKSNKKVIGSLGLHDSWANDDENYKNLVVKQIRYVLSKDYWGIGLMPEAMSGVIHYCFHNLNCDALTCGHFDMNYQSRRVIEKLGFEFVKESEFYAKQLQKSFSDRKYILMNNIAK